jgi:5-methylcytosine-specific restriction endonuclease McrA
MVKNVYRNKVPYSRRNVYIRDQYTCQYCGTKRDLSIDHIIPSSRGGKTNFKNCVTSCVKCNTTKGNRTPEEASMKLNRLPYVPTIMEFLSLKMKNTGVYGFLKEINIY